MSFYSRHLTSRSFILIQTLNQQVFLIQTLNQQVFLIQTIYQQFFLIQTLNKQVFFKLIDSDSSPSGLFNPDSWSAGLLILTLNQLTLYCEGFLLAWKQQSERKEVIECNTKYLLSRNQDEVFDEKWFENLVTLSLFVLLG